MAQAAGVFEVLEDDIVRKRRLPFYVEVLIRLIREKPLGLIGLIIVVGFVLMALIGQWVAPYGANELRTGPRLEGPSWSNFFGTDPLSRDVFSRVIAGARVSMIIGLITVAISTFVALAIALPSGYFGGWFDIIAQRLVDAFIAFPGLVFLIAVGAVFMGSDLPGLPKGGLFQTTNVMLAVTIGVLFGVGQSRVLRGAILGVKAQTFIEAARSTGATDSRMIIKHVLPNIMAPVITLATLNLGNVILIEATLGFLGLGAPADLTTWGNMINQARAQLGQNAWWLAVFPGAALSLAVFGFNMLGDALRDLLDPRLRGTR